MTIINQISKKYNTPKKKALALAPRFPSKVPLTGKDCKETSNLEKCATTWLTSLHEHTQTKQVKDKKRTFLCKSKFCALCQTVKNTKISINLNEHIDTLRKQQKQRFVFLTLSPRSVPLNELKGYIKHISKGFNDLWRNTLAYRMNGYYRRLEITYNENEQGETMAHPHFHILIAVDNAYFSDYFTQEFISRRYADIIGQDINVMTDIKPVKGDIRKSIKELIKYVQKDSELMKLDSHDLGWLVYELKGIRFDSKGGNMRYKKDDEVNEDDVEDSNITGALWKLIGYYLTQHNGKEYVVGKFQGVETFNSVEEAEAHIEAIRLKMLTLHIRT